MYGWLGFFTLHRRGTPIKEMAREGRVRGPRGSTRSTSVGDPRGLHEKSGEKPPITRQPSSPAFTGLPMASECSILRLGQGLHEHVAERDRPSGRLNEGHHPVLGFLRLDPYLMIRQPLALR